MAPKSRISPRPRCISQPGCRRTASSPSCRSRSRATSSRRSSGPSLAFVRHTTVVRLWEAEGRGLGEDVTYDAAEQQRLQARGAEHEVAGAHSLQSFSQLVGSVDLFPALLTTATGEYRRWAFESAARPRAAAGRVVAGGGALGRTPAPVRFVVSRRLLAAHRRAVAGDPPGVSRHEVQARPHERLDGADRRGAGRARCRRGAGSQGCVSRDRRDQPPDPRLYRLVAEEFPDAVLEAPISSSRRRRRPRLAPRTHQLGRRRPPSRTSRPCRFRRAG